MRKHRKYDGKKFGWLMSGIHLAVIIAIAFILVNFVFGVSFVKGKSMEPTFHTDDVVFYTRIVPSFKKGDIVLVRMPSGEYYIKRVIAQAGDSVDIRNGKLYVNDECLEEAYLDDGMITTKKIGGISYPYTVEEGKVFVVGDNRPVSEDSRDFGAVTKRQIKGKMIFAFY